jgi:glyoxylase-like metal-dependent hydrolase (beta-lactamase superfamily II)
MLHSFVFNDFYENTYIIASAGEAIIIDPGCNATAEENQLKTYIESQNLKVVGLINTHCHIDHVFGNQFVKDTYDVKLQAHANEQVILQSVPMVAQMYGIKRYIDSTIDDYLKEGDTIIVGNMNLEVLFLPGHAPGHIGLLNRQENWIVSGDVLFKGSVGRTDFPLCNHQDLINSIKHKLFALPDTLTVYAGHGEPTTIGYEKKYNPFLK